jgi:hypothetical protein
MSSIYKAAKQSLEQLLQTEAACVVNYLQLLRQPLRAGLARKQPADMCYVLGRNMYPCSASACCTA